MSLVIAWRSTKLSEDGHRGLQACRPPCYYFCIFYVFQNQKRDLLPCFVRFLEQYPRGHDNIWWQTVAGNLLEIQQDIWSDISKLIFGNVEL